AAGYLPLAAPPVAAATAAPADDVVISQVYGGGGNSGATYTHDFVELFNQGDGPVTFTGWSIQYGSSTGNFGSGITDLPSVTLAPGEHYLVQESSTANVGSPLPTPDFVDPTPIFMSSSAGKVALVDDTTSLNCGAAATPCGATQLAHVVDLVGYGSANLFEGSGPTGTLSNTTAAIRKEDGCLDTNNNASDFVVATPSPRNTQSPDTPCNSGGISADCGEDLLVEEGDPGEQHVTATDPDSAVVDADVTDVTPDPSPGTIEVTQVDPAAGPGGELQAIVTVSAGVPAGTYVVEVTFTNDDATPQTETCTFDVEVVHVITPMAIQGQTNGEDTLTSPLVGQQVATRGVVTSVLGNGFFIQDPDGDGDPSTSDGLFVFTSSVPLVAVGDKLLVEGFVSEFRRSGTVDLTITELTAPTIKPTGTAALPNPVPVDAPSDQRLMPGIVYWERLEGMRVVVDSPRVVGPTNTFGEFTVVARPDAKPRFGYQPTGVMVLRRLTGDEVDYNTERLTVDDETRVGGGDNTRVVTAGSETGQVAVAAGDLLDDLTGVVDYQFSLFRLQPDTDPEASIVFRQGPPAPGANAVRATAPGELSVVTFNMENAMDAVDDPNKADSPILSAAEVEVKMSKLTLAVHDELKCPDVLLVEEIENATVLTGDAEGEVLGTNAQAVIPRLADLGCPYDAVSREATDDRSIEQGLMWRTDRGITLESYYLTTEGDGNTPAKPDDEHVFDGLGAFNDSREPLVGELTVDGEPIVVIVNHLASKGGDDPLFGTNQPPTRVSEIQRKLQAEYVREYLDDVVFAAHPGIDVIVGGDLNDFPFPEPGEGTSPVTIIMSSPTHSLRNVVLTLPVPERWTYIFQGNAQVLDHLMVGGNLRRAFVEADIAHFDARYGTLYEDDPNLSASVSDHDPPIAWFDRSEL
ncbi:MAG TPA: lamin tail domain-containing protein, partial [Acidimicrobiales bacterium]